VKSGKIELLAPARAVQYITSATDSTGATVLVETSDGRRVSANTVVLGTGYRSSWTKLFDEKTRREIGLEPRPVPFTHDFDNYTTLSEPPDHYNSSETRQTLIYRGIVPAKNIMKRDFAFNGTTFTTNPGYAFEANAHWISSYFLEDTFLRLPSSVDDATLRCLRYNAWIRKRHPDMLEAINESHNSVLSFWCWPQMIDDLLEDMDLPIMRSGGNWLNWPFKVVDLKEIENLHSERRQKRLGSS